MGKSALIYNSYDASIKNEDNNLRYFALYSINIDEVSNKILGAGNSQ